LYWAGHAKSWRAAFWQESVFWLSWTIISPAVFWLCQKLHRGEHTWKRYILGLLAGAAVAAVTQTTIAQSIRAAYSWMGSRLSGSNQHPPSLLKVLPATAVKASSWNLLIFAAMVLGWHAATYYREMRDRQVQAAELESLLHEAQLQALRNQLNPHFLFNTLHSIAELVHENPPLAEQLILRLGELLRKVLASSVAQEVPLGEELDFIKAYIEIEQMRLGERLRVEWDIAPDLADAKVPALILQPLVENAIQHGIAPSDQPGTLVIRARRDDGFLHLQVRDSGPGLIADTDTRPDGIGLSNTEARLQRLYGAMQRFELTSDNGLTVNLRVPLATTSETHRNPG
jgi:hypothetical protein